jgi:hypothetical protein
MDRSPGDQKLAVCRSDRTSDAVHSEVHLPSEDAKVLNTLCNGIELSMTCLAAPNRLTWVPMRRYNELGAYGRDEPALTMKMLEAVHSRVRTW